MTASCLLIVAAVLGQTTDVTYDRTITTDLQYPGRLASAPAGGVYVTDEPAGVVREYDALGAPAGTYAIPELPVGIAVGTNGLIYVARLDGNVGIYDASFTLRTDLGSNGLFDPTPLAMIAPNDLAVHPATGEVYVADTAGHMILVFDGNNGTLARAWGMQGSGLSEFESPQAIAIDPSSNHVIVSDVDNFRVQVFDTGGTLQFKFGYRTLYTGTGELAWFARTEGLAVDSCGHIYVADALMGTVRAFSGSGRELDPQFLPLIGYGTGTGELRTPCDLLIAGDTLYVASTYNAAVEVYQINCTVPPPAPPLVGRNAGAGGKPGGTTTIPWDPPSLPWAQSIPFRPSRLDDPYDIVVAMRAGTYSRVLDINLDRVVDRADLELAVKRFGGATVDDFLSLGTDGGLRGSYPYALQPPHMPDLPVICGRCHSMNGLPGGMLSSWGQENLCLSCHSASGRAMATPIAGESAGNSHAWGVAADTNGVTGLDPGSEMALHLDSGKIRCATCHDPHEQTYGTPYLRVSNDNGALCKQCHRGASAPTEHGANYTKYCTDCHDVHAAEGANLDLIKTKFDTYLFGEVQVAFTDHTVGVGPGAFVDPDPAVRGVCEACHDYPAGDPTIDPPHTLDPSMPLCTQCHQHHNGFRPGLGAFGPGEYIGVTQCAQCHPGKGALQSVHAHSHKLKKISGGPPVYPPEGIYAGVPNTPVGATWNDVSYVIGGYYRKARFINTNGNILIGASGGFDGAMGVETQWNLEFPPAGTGLNWVMYHATDTQPKPYNYSCFQCHTTGPQETPGNFEDWAEPGVQCEACHGPGSDHAGDPLNVNAVIDDSAAQCGTCHTRGSDPLVVQSKGGYIRHHEQWPELLASPHDAFRCVTCHDAHTSAYYDTANAIILDCTICHFDKDVGHHAGKTFSRGSYSEALSCRSCHMPYATKSAAAADSTVVGPLGRMGDIKTHVFNINTNAVDYAAMFNSNGTELAKDVNGEAAVTLDFVCLRCHNGIGNAPNFSLQQASTEAKGYHN